MFKKIALLAGVLAIVAGCSGGYEDQNVSAAQPAIQAPKPGHKHDSTAFFDTDSGYDDTLTANSTKPASTPTPVANRLVVRGATLQVRVQNIDDSEKKVDAAIKSAGGYLENVSSDDLASSNATLSIQAKIPVDKFDDTIAKMEGFGTRLSKSVSMQDVTDPVLELDAKIKELRHESAGYSDPGRSDSDREIADIRSDLAAAEALRAAQAKSAAFATLNLTLKQGAVAGNLQDPSWLGQAYGSASSSAIEAFHLVATVFLWLMFFSPFYVPVGVAVWLANRARRRRMSLSGGASASSI